MKAKTVVAVLAMTWGGIAGQARADALPEKWFVVEEAVNTQSSFMLRVDVDRPDRIYRVGDHMTVTVKPEKDCYLYLLYFSAGGPVACLLPNKFQQENLVRANTPVSVPAADDKFQFTAAPPCGQEVLQVIGTLKPVDIFQHQNLTKGRITPLGTTDLKDMVVELKKGKPQDWAEARIQITTVPADQQPRGKGNRFAVCVGISKFKHERIPPLAVSHKDAERMAAALKDRCGVQDVVLLTNAEATRAAIEKAVFKDLVAKSKPGDEVFIFFSGHGGRCADVHGDKEDGLDKYLVPHDGELGKPETMILDEVFARWLRELDGRKIGIVLDCCYSGGMSKGTRGVKGIGTDAAAKGTQPLDFLEAELRRAKAIGQTGLMVLAACQPNQLAWEMPTDKPGEEGSVLTHFVLKALADAAADGNRDGHLTFGEAHRYTKGPVEEFVKKTFNADQNPVLRDHADDGIFLKP